MASTRLEFKQNSVHEPPDGAKCDARGEMKDVADNATKNSLLEALYFNRHQVIDVILNDHPGLANFEYENIPGFEGTPLQITCSMYHKIMDYKDIGMFVFVFFYTFYNNCI